MLVIVDKNGKPKYLIEDEGNGPIPIEDEEVPEDAEIVEEEDEEIEEDAQR